MTEKNENNALSKMFLAINTVVVQKWVGITVKKDGGSFATKKKL